ncbi:MAG: magnesium transporter [Alphaproteobacteria bacterium]|nr:magnesium transporter [Alphaproteobacteria bacterium]
METAQDNQEEKEPVLDEEAQASARVRETVAAIDNADKAALQALLKDAHEADIADLISLLSTDHRSQFIALIGSELNPAVLAELDEGVRADVAGQLDTDKLVTAVQELETDDAVFVIGDLDKKGQQEILARMPFTERQVLQRALDYPEDSAARLMRPDFVAVQPSWTVGQTIDYLRDTENLPDDFLEILIVDTDNKPTGVVRLNKALRTARPVLMQDIMDERLTLIPADMDREDMARQFERYNLVSAPVVDDETRLLGVITADDVFEVIVEEAEEDILRLGGVGHEAVTDSVLQAASGRFSWLFVNLLTAILASIVIGFFDASIEQMVALAILMPIVASMGGNAATQTLTITVRALATLELQTANAVRIIMREASIGLVNGILFAILVGFIGAFWFDNVLLGIVFASAMIVNMFVAGVSGILVPLGLRKIGVDPAIASGVFVTTITDVIGFLAFLGFATLFLL